MAKDFTTQAGAFLQAEAAKKKPQTPKQEKPKKPKTTPQETKADNIPIGYELKPESKTKRLNLLIRPSLYEALKSKAKATGKSVNDYLNDLINEDISK